MGGGGEVEGLGSPVRAGTPGVTSVGSGLRIWVWGLGFWVWGRGFWVWGPDLPYGALGLGSGAGKRSCGFGV